MSIRLTKNLKRIIADQFILGDSIGYLAGVYRVSHPRIEQVIREALNNSEKEAGKITVVDAVTRAVESRNEH